MDESGLLLIDKPSGVTSRQVDNAIQHLFHTRKVGHLGTLDPFATGLLIVAVNQATKYLPFLPDEEKTYRARLLLGKKTDSGDLTGTVIEEKPVSSLTEEQIRTVLTGFLGESTQIPPMTSAIKKDGVALYKYAHKGIEIEREARPIVIHEISLVSFMDNIVEFVATVSKGTYIRTLGEDIAAKLGTVGHLLSLRREKVGHITLDGAIAPEEARPEVLKEPSSFVAYPRIALRPGQLRLAQNGVKMNFDSTAPRLVLIYEGKAIAIYEKEDSSSYRCLRGL